MRFAKGHGTGNDFVIVPDADGRLDLDADLVRRLCDRRRGIGADGVLRVVATSAVPEAKPDVRSAPWFMDYRNADGSIAEMCGNGIRVFARYLIEHGFASAPVLAIGTRAGIRMVRQETADLFTVDMGPATTGGAAWAVIGGRRYTGLTVSVGNPHLVCVVDGPVEGVDLTVAPEVDPAVFPHGVNVEVVRLTGPQMIEMRVHERGSGETMSCGTGAVAAAVAAAVTAASTVTAAAAAPVPSGGPAASPDGGLLTSDAGQWTVDVPGGRLTVVPGAIASLLSGPAVIVADGEISPSWLAAA